MANLSIEDVKTGLETLSTAAKKFAKELKDFKIDVVKKPYYNQKIKRLCNKNVYVEWCDVVEEDLYEGFHPFNVFWNWFTIREIQDSGNKITLECRDNPDGEKYPLTKKEIEVNIRQIKSMIVCG